MTRRSIVCVVVALAASAVAPAGAADPFVVMLLNEYQGYTLTDRGHTLVNVGVGDFAWRMRCDSATAQRTDSTIHVSVIGEPGPPSASCEANATVDVGRLDAGHYDVLLDVTDSAGAILMSSPTPADIVAHPTQCNDDPMSNRLGAAPAGRSAADFVAAFTTDAAFRARFGDIESASVDATTPPSVALIYPPLADPIVEADAMERTGEFVRVDIARPFCIWVQAFVPVAIVVEFHDTVHDRYFMTADVQEQALIDAGSAGPGWQRTGLTFRVDPATGLCKEALPVFRFTGMPNIGPASHFFTVDRAECAVVRDRPDWHWMLEGVAFGALAPGTAEEPCPTFEYLVPLRTVPLYRLYNNGKDGTPNHRYTIEPGVVGAMVAQGLDARRRGDVRRDAVAPAIICA